jgi:hypothetical protein
MNEQKIALIDTEVILNRELPNECWLLMAKVNGMDTHFSRRHQSAKVVFRLITT